MARVIPGRSKLPYDWLMKKIPVQNISGEASRTGMILATGGNTVTANREVYIPLTKDPITGLNFFMVGHSVVGGPDIVR